MKRTDIVGKPLKTRHKSVLGMRFRFPPFSVWSARDNFWQSRKRYWLATGIKSELGRGEGLLLPGDVGEDIDHYRHKERAKATSYNTGGPGTLAKQFNASPGNSPLPATVRYSDGARGDGRGRRFHAQPGGGPSHKSVYLGANGRPVGGPDSINAKPGETASLKNGLTYGTTLHPYDDHVPNDEASQTGTSIFDPFLCELCYRWLCPLGGTILDPFAGGSVRGVIASLLGRRYIGIDLRKEQVLANLAQADEICDVPDDNKPIWVPGDSRDMLDEDMVGPEQDVDFIFTCPPYYDLELYSDNPNDLSNMSWEEFCESYKLIITNAVKKLRNDRFACFVVGDLRDKDGFYRNLPALTTQFFLEAGCRLYNEGILVTSVGSLPLRVQKQYVKSRKFGRSHQTVLMFVKGSPVLASELCEPVESLGYDFPDDVEPEEDTIVIPEPPVKRRRASL